MAIQATVPLMFQDRARKRPDAVVQAYKGPDGIFQTRTYRELYGDVLDCASALKSLGIGQGTNVGLISDNRREWLIADLATLSLGAADVPRGCDSMEREISFILSTTECPLAFIENKNQLTKILNSSASLPALKTLVMFNEPEASDVSAASGKGITLRSFWAMMKDGATWRASHPSAVEDEMAKGSGEDIATIIFTSGTTGEPKGVMLTQSNYTWQLARTPGVLHSEPGDIWLTVLPVWHSFERCMQYIILESGSGMAYSKPVASVMFPDIAAVRPHIIPGVPRLWEALAAGIFRAIKKEGGVMKAMFGFFVGVGKR
jgi:long-chain acyl-CoA synthetase